MVRQSDIAARAGVSSFTVSCALRGLACVAPETARRISEIAEKMGYRPSAAARLLARRRSRSRAEARQPAIALVSFSHEPWAVARTRDPRLKEIARREGFSLQVARLPEFSSPAEMSRVLWARGVQGLILFASDAPPDFRLRDMEGFEWNRFSIVKISRGFDELKCHTVGLNIFFQTHFALERIIAAGYRRILILLLSTTASREEDWMRYGAIEMFRKMQARSFDKMTIHTAPVIGPAISPALKARIAKLKPDIVLAFPFSWRFHLEANGYRIPDDFAFAGMLVESDSIGDRDRPTSGPLGNFCEQEFPVALHMLQEEIALGHKGMPIFQFEHSVSVPWRRGVTMPEPAPRASCGCSPGRSARPKRNAPSMRARSG